jgi:hypothetical protein
MHIHGSSMNFSAAGMASGVGEKAAAERAAETRRKLMSRAGRIDAASGAAENGGQSGQWMEAWQGLRGEEDPASGKRGDRDFG